LATLCRSDRWVNGGFPTVCGRDAGRQRWLDDVLGEDETTPTLPAMHHPPMSTGVPAMDAIGIAQDQREALAEIVSVTP
jgi:hypothetical protein